jgi:MinD-like ATPase involved in chromosome partitioning or flagellar assembly
VRSVGFTSTIGGEGKSLLASTTATALAHDSEQAVVLMECNWEHPTLHDYFGIPATPGLAEWLRGECGEGDIRSRAGHNLAVIPAGNGQRDAVRLAHRLRHHGLTDKLVTPHERVILDLPAIATTVYGSLAASLVETLIVVVRAGVTSENLIAETCTRLHGLPVHGLLLNQVESRIPHWLRQLL